MSRSDRVTGARARGTRGPTWGDEGRPKHILIHRGTRGNRADLRISPSQTFGATHRSRSSATRLACSVGCVNKQLLILDVTDGRRRLRRGARRSTAKTRRSSTKARSTSSTRAFRVRCFLLSLRAFTTSHLQADGEDTKITITGTQYDGDPVDINARPPRPSASEGSRRRLPRAQVYQATDITVSDGGKANIKCWGGFPVTFKCYGADATANPYPSFALCGV